MLLEYSNHCSHGLGSEIIVITPTRTGWEWGTGTSAIGRRGVGSVQCGAELFGTSLFQVLNKSTWLALLSPRPAALLLSWKNTSQAAGEDRVWKNLCHRRWQRVNVHAPPGRGGRGGSGGSGHQMAYACLNGWRDPKGRLRRTILTTAPGFSAVGWVVF